MQDRSYIKWAPFNSLINDKSIIKEIITKKNFIDKPVLSDDQTEYLNDKMFEAYTNHLKVKLIIYKNQNLINLVGFVNDINTSKKYITFNNAHIYFNQIINIYNFFEEI